MKKVFSRGDSRIVLHFEDCFAGMDRMLADSVDVVVTSPPYNLGIEYGTYDDTIDRDSYLDWLEDWSVRVRRVLSPRGSLFLNVGGKPKDQWGPLEVAMRLRRHLVLQNTIHWIKSIAIDRADDHSWPRAEKEIIVGHIKPINSRRYISDAHEYIFHFTKEGDVELDRLAVGVPYKDKSNIGRWKSAGKDVRCRGNTWFIPYRTIVSRERDRPHPATFPPSLAEMCIKLHGLSRVRLVMDPFLGLGNTAVACLGLNVPCIGYEIGAEYFEYACRRISELCTEESNYNLSPSYYAQGVSE